MLNDFSMADNTCKASRRSTPRGKRRGRRRGKRREEQQWEMAGGTARGLARESGSTTREFLLSENLLRGENGELNVQELRATSAMKT